MNKTVIALLLGACFAVGCGDKTDGAGSGSAKASAAPAASSAKPAASGASTSAGGSTGSKSCDEYWAKVQKCNDFALKSMPDGAQKDTAKKTQDEAIAKTKEGWKALSGDQLEQACKPMLDAMAAQKCE